MPGSRGAPALSPAPALSWRTRLWGVALVNLATMVWATNAVAGRWLREDIGPLTLTALRISVASMFFCWLLRGRPAEERRFRPHLWWLLGMGLTGALGFSLLLYLGLHYSTAVNSSLFQGFSPLITALLAWRVIGEPVSRAQLGGAVLGLAGVTGLISGGSLDYLLGLNFNLGDVLLLGAAVLWAFYSVFGRQVMRQRSPVSATALSSLLVLPLAWGLAIWELSSVPVNLTAATVAAIVHVCVAPTLLGFWAWNRSVQLLGTGGAMVFYNTLPLYGALLGALVLSEPLGTTHMAFGGLILLGGVWGTLGRRSL